MACIGLLKAVDGFDLQRDTPFTAYAIPTITGELRRHFRDKGWMVRPPRSIQELSLRVERDSAAASRASSAAGLAERLGVPLERLVEAREARQAMRPTSLDRPLLPGPDDAGDPLVEVLGTVDPGFQRIEDVATLRDGVRALSQQDRRILEMRYGEELTQNEIGDRLGVSQMQISRRLHRILASLGKTALADPDPDLRIARTA